MSDHIKDQLSELLDQRLTSPEKLRVEGHLKTCANCQTAYEQLLDLRANLRSNSPELTPPESFYSGVLSRIESQKETQKTIGWGWPIKIFATACVLMLVVLAKREVREPVVANTPSRDASPAPASITMKDTGAKESDDLRAVDSLSKAVEQRADKPMSVPRPTQNEIFEGAEEVPLEAMVSQPEKKDRQYRKVASSVAEDVGVYQSYGGSSQVQEKTKATGSMKRMIPVGRTGGDVVIGGKSRNERPVGWRSTYSQIQNEETLTIRTQDELMAFWVRHRGAQDGGAAMPVVDFSTQMLVGVFLGARPSSGYEVRIENVQQTPQGLVVEYREETPPQGTFGATVMTYPHELKVVPRSDLPVQFKRLSN